MTMTQGKVSISARDATVAQILREWARVGQTRIVNIERLGGGPLTLELSGVSELQALEVLLRGTGGYVLASRPVISPTVSMYDRILVVPTSTAPRPTATVAPPPPTFQMMRVPPPSADPDDEAAQPPGGGDAAGRFPQPRPATAEPATIISPPTPRLPTTSMGVQRPGMPVPVPSPGPGPATPQE